jgi:hypothetical protein
MPLRDLLLLSVPPKRQQISTFPRGGGGPRQRMSSDRHQSGMNKQFNRVVGWPTSPLYYVT